MSIVVLKCLCTSFVSVLHSHSGVNIDSQFMTRPKYVVDNTSDMKANTNMKANKTQYKNSEYMSNDWWITCDYI